MSVEDIFEREIDFQRRRFYEDEEYDPFQITFYFNQKGKLYGFLASGKTGFSQHGLDIIAAAVSALIINAINSVKLLTKELVEFDLQKNFAKCVLPKNTKSIEGVILLESLRLGIQSIQDSYGDKFVTIVDIREEKRKSFSIFK